MLSVREAADKLGVTDVRIRAMLKSGKLDGHKVGRAWVVSERSVAQRLREGGRPGRPTRKAQQFERKLPDIDMAHHIYDEAERVLSGCYDSGFLSQARTPDEQAFWIRVADFFLQKKQRELVEKGVF